MHSNSQRNTCARSEAPNYVSLTIPTTEDTPQQMHSNMQSEITEQATRTMATRKQNHKHAQNEEAERRQTTP